MVKFLRKVLLLLLYFSSFTFLQPGLMGGGGRYLRLGCPPIRYPPARSDGRGVPEVGYPSIGVLLARSDRGYPRLGTPWQGTPTWTLLRYPPPPGPGSGTPLGVDRWMDGWMDGWTDTCENITFPLYYVCGR